MQVGVTECVSLLLADLHYKGTSCMDVYTHVYRELSMDMSVDARENDTCAKEEYYFRMFFSAACLFS